MKKTTIKDVAKAVGVSIATVSYVINNKDSEKISEATKKKVFQWINLLNYEPNIFAKGLSTNKSMNIAFISSPNLSYLQKIELMNFLELFSAYILTKGYKLLYIYQTNKETIKNVDSIVCYNMAKEQFYELGEVNTVPMIAVDLLLNDAIFYQITKDYELINQACKFHFNNDFVLITTKPKAIETEEEIKKIFSKVIFIEMIEDISNIFMSNKQQNILLFDSFLKNIFENLYPETNIFYYNLRTQERFDKIFEAIIYAINREDDKEHFIKI